MRLTESTRRIASPRVPLARAGCRPANATTAAARAESLEGRALLSGVYYVSDASVREGDSGTSQLVFTVEWVGSFPTEPGAIIITTSDGTASAAQGDYVHRQAALQFAPEEGPRRRSFRVDVNPDMRDEADETVIVTLSMPGPAVIADGTGIGTIREDDDRRPTAALAPVPEQRDTPIDSATVTFSEQAMGLDAVDFHLSRDGGPNLLTSAQTLTTVDNVTYSLNNLAAITAAPGQYALTLSDNPATSFITDLEYNDLAGGALTAWRVLPPDPDDQIAEAVAAGNGTRTGSIGSGIDVDMFAVTVLGGDTVTFDVDLPLSGLDSVLRLFNAFGTELAQSDDTPGPAPEVTPAESFITYTFPADGTYYVGVSNLVNSAYHPVTGADTPGFGGGDYTLTIAGIGVDPDDQILEARQVGNGTITGGITTATDVDMVAITVQAGDHVEFDVDGPAVRLELDSVLRLFDASGAQLAINDRGEGPVPEGGNGEAFLAYTFARGGTYYVAVSAAGNDRYDPNTGVDSGRGTPGAYTLTIAGISAAAPRVARVYLDGTTWDRDFRDDLVEKSIGDAAFGYAVPGMAGQLASIPWMNVDKVSIRFTQDVAIEEDDLSVRSALPGLGYGTTPATFTYDPSTYTATWTLYSALANFPRGAHADRVRLVLSSDPLTGVTGTTRSRRPLDGNWADGATIGSSGDGVDGGDFNFGVNVVPTDADRNGRVTALDVSFVRQRMNKNASGPSTGPGGYSPFADFDAGGRINALDLSAVKQRLNLQLPPPSPAPPPSPFGDLRIDDAAPEVLPA